MDPIAGTVSPQIRPDDAGVTLIELLVVVAVLAVLAVGVSLSAGRVGGGAGPGDAAAFQARFGRAQSLAVHGGYLHGIALGAKGSTLMHRVSGRWQALGQERRWRGRVTHTITHAATPGLALPGGEVPDILFLPNGQTSTFRMTFAARGFGARAVVRCQSDGWTGVQCDAG